MSKKAYLKAHVTQCYKMWNKFFKNECNFLVFRFQGEDVTMMASMVKLKAGRLSRQVTDGCLQFFGGMGFTNEVNRNETFLKKKD